MNTPRNDRRAALPALLASALLCVAVPAAGGDPLGRVPDPSRVAFLARPEAGAGAIAHAAAEAGLAAGSHEPHPISGWYVADLPLPARTPAGVAARVHALAGSPDVAFAAAVDRDAIGGVSFVLPRMLVRLDDPSARAPLDAFLAARGAGIVTRVDGFGILRIESTRTESYSLLEDAASLAEIPGVRYAEPDVVFTGRGHYVPNDPAFPQSWALHNTGQPFGVEDVDLDAPEAWDITIGAASVQVAVFDTGVQQNHPEIHQVPGFDVTSEGGSGGPMNECDNHGTPVAGCVSARIDNSRGSAGIAPGARVFSVRTFISSLSCDGTWTSAASWTVDALELARGQARVTNNSNHYGFQSQAIADAYQNARNTGLVHFAAAGNFGGPTVAYPGSLPSVHAVGAVDRFGAVPFWSQGGPDLSLSAPGVSNYLVDRTGPDGWSFDDDVVASGTSFASPFAAGVAALIFSGAILEPDDVDALLIGGSVDHGDPGRDDRFGQGMVNAYRSLVLREGVDTTNLNFFFQPVTFSGCEAIDESSTACPNLFSRAADGPIHVWVLASQPEGFLAGIASVEFGISYDPSVDVQGWTLCTGGGESVQDDVLGVWPQVGTGNRASWPALCHRPPGDVARVGFFLVGGGSVGAMAFVPDPRAGRIASVDCAGLTKETLPSEVGTMSFAGGTVPFCGEVSVAVEPQPAPPADPGLSLAPNPFRPSARLTYEMAAPGEARITIHDASGRTIAVVVDGHRAPGTHVTTWDGRDGSGRAVGTGVYFVRLEADGRTHTRKITRIE